ncbi:MAG: hypothetical protein M3N57_02650, partial [Actinomycetota bacterium]|nr:hypothetical protein [Actinomycetota bacterium]
DEAFGAAGWEPQPYIVDPSRTDLPATGLKADFKRDKIQIEAQFGNMARWYTDVFKFQLSYSIDQIDVAVLIVPMKRFANLIDENVAYMERISRELPTAKMSLTLPIWVIGVEPEDYAPIEKRYDEGFEAQQARTEKEIAKIPMRARMEEDEQEDATEESASTR